MAGIFFLAMFLVTAGTLVWRIVITKSRKRALRIGAAAAVMMTLVGAFVVFDEIDGFSFRNIRADLALLAASTGSFYLILWSLRRHTNRRHRTISLVAAILGLVPAVAALASALIFGKVS